VDRSESAVAKLAYERASARLDQQRARLSEIRTNASILIAATALVASFLGKWSLDKGEGVFGRVALVAFVLGILCGIAPVWPVLETSQAGVRGLLSRVTSADSAAKLTGGLLWGRGPTVAEVLTIDEPRVYEELATALDRCASDNEKIIVRRSTWVVGCGTFLAVQVVLWIVNGLAEG
jgi:hypothetical protein